MLKPLISLIKYIFNYFFPKDLNGDDVIKNGEKTWQNRRTGFYAGLNYQRRFLGCFVVFSLLLYIIFAIVMMRFTHSLNADNLLYNGFKHIINVNAILGAIILALQLPIQLYYYIDSGRADALQKTVDNGLKIIDKKINR